MDEQYEKHLAHMHSQTEEVLARSKKRAAEHKDQATLSRTWERIAFDAGSLAMVGLGLAFIAAHAWFFLVFFMASAICWVAYYILSRRTVAAFYKLGICDGAHQELSILLGSLEKAARSGKGVDFKDGGSPGSK